MKRTINETARSDGDLIKSEIVIQMIDDLQVSIFAFELFGPGLPGAVIYANEFMCQMLGYRKNELVNISPIKFLKEENKGEFSNFLEELLAKSRSSIRMCLKSKGGSDFHVDLSSHALPLGKSMLIVSIARELTINRSKLKRSDLNYESLQKLLEDRTSELKDAHKIVEITKKQLQKSEESFRLITEKMPQMVWTALPDGYVNYFSNQWLAYCGHTLEEAIGWGWTSALHPEDYKRTLGVWDHARRTGCTYDISYRLKSAKTNQYRWHIARGVPQKGEDGQIEKWFGTCTDIEELVQTQNKLKSIAKTLEDSNRELEISRKQLKIAKESAEKANNGKSEFLANISHELRTPLNSIIGYTQLLERSGNCNKPENNFLKIISRNGKHLLTLINDVLEMSKIEAGFNVLNKKNTNLHLMLQNIENMMRSRAEEKGIKLVLKQDLKLPMFILLDDVKLRQVLINLLGNAIKFTKKGSVCLQVSVNTTDNTSISQEGLVMLHFSIQDTGIGIPSSELKSIFNAFYQVSPMHQSTNGTGIGLAICQKYVKLMGDEIIVKSREGKGSTFSFSMAVKPVRHIDINTIRNKKVEQLHHSQSRYRILVVDDNMENRKLLTHLLSPVGFKVREAENGADAVRLHIQWSPHLIWMDIRMPVMNGFEATKKIRSITDVRQPVIIALTSHAFEKQRKLVLSSGFDDFVSKPFDEDILFRMIEKHIGAKYCFAKTASAEAEKIDLDPEFSCWDPGAIQSLPSVLRKNLKAAAVNCDMELVDRAIGEIGRNNKELSEHLKVLSNNYRYDMLIKIMSGDI